MSIQQNFSDIQSMTCIGAQQAESFVQLVLCWCASLPRAVWGGPLAQRSLSIPSLCPLGEIVLLVGRRGGVPRLWLSAA